MEGINRIERNSYVFEQMSRFVKQAIEFTEISEIDNEIKKEVLDILKRTLERMNQKTDSFSRESGDVVYYTLSQIQSILKKDDVKQSDLFSVIRDFLWTGFDSTK